MLERRGAALEGEAGEAAAAGCRVCALCGSEFKIMGLYNRFCKRFFAGVIIRLTAQSDSRALSSPLGLRSELFVRAIAQWPRVHFMRSSMYSKFLTSYTTRTPTITMLR